LPELATAPRLRSVDDPKLYAPLRRSRAAVLHPLSTKLTRSSAGATASQTGRASARFCSRTRSRRSRNAGTPRRCLRYGRSLIRATVQVTDSSTISDSNSFRQNRAATTFDIATGAWDFPRRWRRRAQPGVSPRRPAAFAARGPSHPRRSLSSRQCCVSTALRVEGSAGFRARPPQPIGPGDCARSLHQLKRWHRLKLAQSAQYSANLH
jgi:hypothetical protein